MLQESFDFIVKPSYLVEDFIITDSNKLSFEKIVSWPAMVAHNTYPYFLLLCGSKQSGKTHLAHIWSRANGATILHSTKEFMGQTHAIVIEDIDQAIWHEEELLHIFNLCHEHKVPCLFTSSVFPIDFKLADLNSRIKSIDRIKIEQPDKETIKIILFKEFAKKSLYVDPKVVAYLADVIPHSFNSAHEAVSLLDKASLNMGRQISYSLIKQIFLTE